MRRIGIDGCQGRGDIEQEGRVSRWATDLGLLDDGTHEEPDCIELGPPSLAEIALLAAPTRCWPHCWHGVRPTSLVTRRQ